MIIQTVYNYVAKRVNKVAEADFFEELNRAYSLFWYQVDARDALCEMELQAVTERQLTLPWFVHELKGVRDAYDTPLQLRTPRPYYNQNAPPQSDYEWRVMHRTPLFLPISVSGRLTIRPRRKLTTPVTINFRGPGEFGVTEIESLTLAANVASAETTAIFHDLSSLSKSSMTAADIEIYDIADVQVGIIPADRTDVWCQMIQLVDSRHSNVNNVTQSFYTVLFKQQPPRFSSFTDAIPEEYGLLIQDIIVESLLAARPDAEAQKVSENFGRKVRDTAGNIISKHLEPFATKVNIGPNPYTMRFRGYL